MSSEGGQRPTGTCRCRRCPPVPWDRQERTAAPSRRARTNSWTSQRAAGRRAIPGDARSDHPGCGRSARGTCGQRRAEPEENSFAERRGGRGFAWRWADHTGAVAATGRGLHAVQPYVAGCRGIMCGRGRSGKRSLQNRGVPCAVAGRHMLDISTRRRGLLDAQTSDHNVRSGPTCSRFSREWSCCSYGPAPAMTDVGIRLCVAPQLPNARQNTRV